MPQLLNLKRSIALTLVCFGLLGAGCGAEQSVPSAPEPGKMEPGGMESGKMEPGGMESGKMESGKMESGKMEP